MGVNVSTQRINRRRHQRQNRHRHQQLLSLALVALHARVQLQNTVRSQRPPLPIAIALRLNSLASMDTLVVLARFSLPRRVKRALRWVVIVYFRPLLLDVAPLDSSGRDVRTCKMTRCVPKYSFPVRYAVRMEYVQRMSVRVHRTRPQNHRHRRLYYRLSQLSTKRTREHYVVYCTSAVTATRHRASSMPSRHRVAISAAATSLTCRRYKDVRHVEQ